MSLIGIGRFDLSAQSNYTFALRHRNAKTIVVEFAPDGNGNASGSVAVFIGDASSAAPYFSVDAKSLRFYPSPDAEYVTLVPSSGAHGLVTVSISQDNLGIGICPFESGGGGAPAPGTDPTAVSFGAYSDGAQASAASYSTPPGSLVTINAFASRSSSNQELVLAFGPSLTSYYGLHQNDSDSNTYLTYVGTRISGYDGNTSPNEDLVQVALSIVVYGSGGNAIRGSIFGHSYAANDASVDLSLIRNHLFVISTAKLAQLYCDITVTTNQAQ